MAIPRQRNFKACAAKSGLAAMIRLPKMLGQPERVIKVPAASRQYIRVERK